MPDIISRESADAWTNLSSVSKALSEFVSNFFWLSYTVDLFSDRDSDTPIGVSYYGLGVGLALAAFATFGSVYCQRILNLEHQTPQALPDPKLLTFNGGLVELERLGLLTPSIKRSPALTHWQKIALAGAGIKLLGETSAPLNFVLDLCAGDQLNLKAHMGINAGITVFAMLGSYADFRTLWLNLVTHNKKSRQGLDNALSEEEAVADIWTNAAALREAITSSVSNFFWIAGMVDLFGGLNSETPIGLSHYALGVGAAIALFNTVGSVYCHWVLNTEFQTAHQPGTALEPLSSAPSLSKMQRIALLGDWFGHIGEVSGPLGFVLDLAAKGRLGKLAHILITIALGAWGFVGSYADVRTCWQNLLKRNQGAQAARASLLFDATAPNVATYGAINDI